ncbi:MAG: glycosyltransferase family 1 protein [Xanthobacteraceae bacterium]
MNVGIFVTTLRPSSPSQARLQDAIFSGLRKVAAGRYRFIVFSHDPSSATVGGDFIHESVARYGKCEELARRWRARLARALLQAWQFLGASGGRTWQRLSRLSKFEPRHFQQMRDLNIRLLWNMNQHELKVPVPFIRTIWEANHRIHSMFPEYSYARYGYEGLESGLADSLARASYVVTGTSEGKRQVVEMIGVHAGKVRVIPFPAPILADGSPGPLSMAPGRYILYPARFWPHKNHVVILEALKILKQEQEIELHCIFTGADHGNLTYVMSYAERLGVRDSIEYRGEVSEGELAELYSGALALVYASAVGPDNLPPLEAMALGRPVIAADVPGAREQYDDAALYFPPTDERVLADCLAALIRNDTLHGPQILRGKARIAALTPDGYAAGILRILDEFSAVARAWERCDSEFS